MNQSNMPWSAVAFDKITGKAAAMETSFLKDLPCLVLVDAGGRILSKSGDSDAPEKVLADLDKVFAHLAVARAP